MRSTPETRDAARFDGQTQAKAMQAEGLRYFDRKLDTSAWGIPADVWACVRGFEQAWGRP